MEVLCTRSQWETVFQLLEVSCVTHCHVIGDEHLVRWFEKDVAQFHASEVLSIVISQDACLEPLHLEVACRKDVSQWSNAASYVPI